MIRQLTQSAVGEASSEGFDLFAAADSISRLANLRRSHPRGSIREQVGPNAKSVQYVCHDILP